MQAPLKAVLCLRDREERRLVDLVICRGHAEAVGVEVKFRSAITEQDIRQRITFRWISRRRSERQRPARESRVDEVDTWRLSVVHPSRPSILSLPVRSLVDGR